MRKTMDYRIWRKLAALLLLAGALAGPIWAWPFGRGEAKPNERVVAKLDKARGADFQKAVTLRQLRSEELRVLARLVEEKKSELAGFNAKLKAICAMSDDAMYSYSATNRTLYLVSTNATHGATADQPALIPHHAFPNEEEAGVFLRTLGAKQVTQRQIDTFGDVIREKQAEYRLTDKYLSDNYGIRPDKNYRFDEKTGELFDLTPPEKGRKVKPSAKEEPAKAASAKASASAKKTQD